ncbi:hypothetical protein RHSIM_Rhsim09G0060800 [Rhododendron simsii]|uniref:Uncharacterized protein n=1 Tax=Rhododendron simsii TaxID=118357 RepID=A0A834GLJ7_RHOSS|nr:hypothetical protein RHSIM_Rhsim09G0060800 [Rhododendron simsii]
MVGLAFTLKSFSLGRQATRGRRLLGGAGEHIKIVFRPHHMTSATAMTPRTTTAPAMFVLSFTLKTTMVATMCRAMVMIFSATKALYESFVVDIRGTSPIFNNVTMPMDRVPAIDPTTSCRETMWMEKVSPIVAVGTNIKAPSVCLLSTTVTTYAATMWMKSIAGGVFPPMTTLTVCFIAAMS